MPHRIIDAGRFDAVLRVAGSKGGEDREHFELTLRSLAAPGRPTATFVLVSPVLEAAREVPNVLDSGSMTLGTTVAYFQSTRVAGAVTRCGDRTDATQLRIDAVFTDPSIDTEALCSVRIVGMLTVRRANGTDHDMATIEQLLVDMVRRHVPERAVTPRTTLSDLGLDSIALLKLASDLEGSFGIDLDARDDRALESLEDIAALIADLQAGRQ